MQTISATVECQDSQYFIRVRDGGMEVLIPMSEDKPNEVKNAFNQIIIRIKCGEFQIKLEGVGEDLYSQIANAYIGQLNREILEIHDEMKEYGLL